MPSESKKKTWDEKFLDAWRNLEATLREVSSLGVQDIESRLTSQCRENDANRLRICRQVRNFLVHDGQGFVAATPAMAAFLDAVADECRRAKGTVKDHMVTAARYGCAKPDDLICDAASTMLSKKRQDVLVIAPDGAFLGLLDGKAMATALKEGAGADRISWLYARKALDATPDTVAAALPSADAPERKCVVLDGKGRCIGVWNPEGAWS